MTTLSTKLRRKKSLSKMIQKVTTAYGMTNVALAKELGVHHTTFQHWAVGRTGPKTDAEYARVKKHLSDLLDKLEKPLVNSLTEQQELPLVTALDVQIGGSHYKDSSIQPVQYSEANDLNFLEGCIVKRVTRHNKPTGKGREDIEKLIHEAQLLLELRYGA